ncbi:hypothetical protein C7S16_1862 [Burkholderia thailandensis]|uniref:Uncharacterized protein n=1 Tax=Burkholderia thailandensis TaxID=57975 RepID=A0AAW9D535_BURTH|nr:hypothetical protein [Burkholderia thailandensis]MDW9257073.1 hypothetical protein [Burkholderia thailandensis]
MLPRAIASPISRRFFFNFRSRAPHCHAAPRIVARIEFCAVNTR